MHIMTDVFTPWRTPLIPKGRSSASTFKISNRLRLFFFYHRSLPVCTAGGIPIVIKSTKPPLSFDFTVHPTDTVSRIKLPLEKEHLRAPTADSQRLLIKGKVLADHQLSKEYPISTDSSSPTLTTKPGSTGAADTMQLPSLTLSPTPSTDGQTPGVDLALAVELDMQLGPPRGSTPTQDAYTSIIADPGI
ncbi:hypothetical protein FRC01_000091 [Tulasnella sp. 417]|nr:hypothetical protein FRC01_000091 [Tulasnella sp. 417]